MILHRLLCAVALLSLLSCSRPGGVTAANLLASERWWPYRVQLREAWPVPGRDEPLPAGLRGVLIRVENSGLPRIDFGRIGKYEIPVEKTNLLELANQIRLGQAQKEAPNFVYAIRSRMLDSASDPMRGLPIEAVTGHRAFLCVFVDPDDAGFDALARALAPLNGRGDVMTLLFPQGRHADAPLRDRLRALDWKVPFLYDFLSEPYTRTLLPDATPFPYVMLQTSEGRVLLEEAWSADTAARLTGAMEPG